MGIIYLSVNRCINKNGVKNCLALVPYRFVKNGGHTFDLNRASERMSPADISVGKRKFEFNLGKVWKIQSYWMIQWLALFYIITTTQDYQLH